MYTCRETQVLSRRHGELGSIECKEKRLGKREVCLLYYLNLRLSSTLGSSLVQVTLCTVFLASFVSYKIINT